MVSSAAGMVLEAWKDLDRVTTSLAAQDAERRIGTASPISWSVAHLSEQIDRWLNSLFQGLDPHSFVSQDHFRFGAAGEPADWSEVQQAVAEVRERARPYLESLTDADLDRRFPYEGALAALRERGITARHACVRIALHHYFHIGEIASARNALGHSVGDYPGLLEELL